MSTRGTRQYDNIYWLLLLTWPALGNAQVPIDADGEPIGDFAGAQTYSTTGNEDIPLLSAQELDELVGPVALYPDDLLAIVLPAAAYPLQIVQAGRFLEALEDDPSLQPDESWDDSVVALTNYPEVVKLMNDDLDWTWRLGEAVVAQQSDVINAVEAFRDRAYAAGNLKSDDYQTITQEDDHIEITPVEDDVIYVPYYEPERVVVYQPRPVYYYYPQPYPVYYYPYPSSYAFNRGYFWGVTTAFALGWHSERLHVFHHSYFGHPYYGRTYRPRWWYRQPTLTVYNNIYAGNRHNRHHSHYRYGDDWHVHNRRSISRDDVRVTRTRHYPGSGSRAGNNHVRDKIHFRERPDTLTRNFSRSGREDRVSERRATTRPRTDEPRRHESTLSPVRKSERKSSDLRRSGPKLARQHSTSSRRNESATTSSRPRAARPTEGRRADSRRSEPRVRQPAKHEPRKSQPRVRESKRFASGSNEPRARETSKRSSGNGATQRNTQRHSEAPRNNSRKSVSRESKRDARNFSRRDNARDRKHKR